MFIDTRAGSLNLAVRFAFPGVQQRRTCEYTQPSTPCKWRDGAILIHFKTRPIYAGFLARIFRLVTAAPPLSTASASARKISGIHSDASLETALR